MKCCNNNISRVNIVITIANLICNYNRYPKNYSYNHKFIYANKYNCKVDTLIYKYKANIVTTIAKSLLKSNCKLDNIIIKI